MKRFDYLLAVILLFPAYITSAQTPKLTRGPYLQVVTPTSVIVRWQTDQPTTGRVWFGASATQLTGDLRESQTTLDHSVTISGLQPATKYAYAIGYGDTQLAAGPDYYAKTAPPSGDTRPIRMWVLGDFGNGSDNQKSVYQAYLNATATRPADLWLWLGDNAYSFGKEEEYQQWVFPFYAPTLRNLPSFATPGNHDYADSNTNFDIAYYRMFSFPQQGEAGGVPSGSKSYFSADYGNVHLISLDSQGQEGGQYRLYDTTGTQVQWLKRDLAANKLPWTIVMFHHPPYSKGGHNSDTEEQLKLIRENLTPILERYGVDLVLNGHSHGYERYYRLKGQRGLANTFDKNVHIAENTIARYDGSPNSCPILTKGKGIVYVVNGSGGSLGGQSTDYPHPGMIYGNTIVGGSMILDVNDNRLDAQFILSDGSIPDKFTIMKNVNKTASLTTEYADTLQFKASWPGDYRWSGGQTSRSIRYVADKAGTFPVTVTDALNCLTDQFTVTVQQPPKITAKTLASVCAGGILAVTATPENTTKAAGWQYDVFLSDASGSFAAEQVVGSGKLNELKATIPANLPTGKGYKLRIRPRGISYAEAVPSGDISVQSLPTATLAGSTTISVGQSASLTLNFTGNGPWKGSLSDGTVFSGTTSPFVLPVQPAKSIVYSITTIENECGKGTGSGQASVTVQPPLKVTAKTSTSSCVGGSLTVAITLENTLQATPDLQYDVLISDASGNFAKEQIVGTGKINELKATIPGDLPAGTGYRLRVRPRGISNAELVSSDGFAIKPLPTATLAGSSTVVQGQPVSLTLSFTGEGPWRGSLSDGTAFSASITPSTITVQPAKSIVYSITSIENGCGKGSSSGQASITVLLPTEIEEFAGGRLRIYPNPAHDIVNVELSTTHKEEVHITLRDAQGRSVFQKQFGVTTSLHESLPMPANAGIYLLTVQVGQETLTRKIVRQ